MLVVTPGDPDGVGPEVAVRGLAATGLDAMLVGEQAVLEPWCDQLGVDAPIVEPLGDEPIEVRALRFAVDACLHGGATGLVTGPINKHKLAATGFEHPGHTDFLGALCGVERPVMAFVGGRARVALVTVHLPLAAVPKALTSERVHHTIVTAAAALRRYCDRPSPRLVVCGLNPHAGDGGLLGAEEADVIRPAVEKARAEGLDVVGPLSAESAFLPNQGGDMIIAMYHDQGLVPLKALDFGRTVNWTLGLPILRTSVDHGTAYDLVGTDRVRADSMIAALSWADRCSRSTTDPDPDR